MKSIAIRFLLPVGLLIVLLTLFLLFQAYTDNWNRVEEFTNREAALAMEYNLAIRDYAAKCIRPKMEKMVGPDEFYPETMSTSYISRCIFEKVREKIPDCIIRFASENPRNPLNRAHPDELAVIEYFRQHPNENRKVQKVMINDRKYLAHFTPKRLQPACLRCHGDPKDAPADLVKRYGAQASFHRKIGDVVAMDTVAVPLDAMKAVMVSRAKWNALFLIGGIGIVSWVGLILFRRIVSKPLAAMAEHFRGLSDDIQSDRITPLEIKGNGEISIVGDAFNRLVKQLRASQSLLEQRVQERTVELSRVNEELRKEVLVRKIAEKELHLAARLDKLTNLPNRNLLQDRLNQAVLRSRRSPDYSFALLFIDLDGFKLVNDSFGHEAGDMLLTEAAKRLRNEVRALDTISRETQGNTAARLGGDEFIILLDGVEGTLGAEAAAQRILTIMAQPYRIKDHDVVCSVSIGIVVSKAFEGTTEDLVRDADTALYEAKRNGRNCSMMFDASMRERVRSRMALESDLRKALDAGQFVMNYQPIFAMGSDRVESCEALIRWQHPERGGVSPAAFIPIAEDSGLILPIGEWVVRQACRDFLRWRQEDPERAPRSISINVSRRQLACADLPDRFETIFREEGMSPADVMLEVTEGAVMKDVQGAASVLRRLKSMKFRLAMDDFGTGYSSLACLHQFPIDVVKIDRAFVANLEKGREFVQFAKAIVSLAHSLRMSVVAEGVETAGQLAVLQSIDCHRFQGYLFSRAIDPAAVLNCTVPNLLLLSEGAAAETKP